MPAYTLYSIGIAEQKITENLYDSEAERMANCFTGIRFIRIRVDREI